MEYTKGELRIVEKQGQSHPVEIRYFGEGQIAQDGDVIAEVYSRQLAHKFVAALDLYEALREVKLVWQGLDPDIKFPHLQEVIEQALTKAGGVHNG